MDALRSYAVKHGLPCLNPNCKSKGRPHYGCLCYGGGGEGDYAKGGKVCSAECEVFADGGAVSPHKDLSPNPATTLGHAALHHGLLGILKDVGHSKLSDPEKHGKVLEKAKQHLAMNNHEKAADVLHGHALAGSIGKDKLKHVLGSLSPALLSQDSSPSALRSSVDYLHSAIKGHSALEGHAGDMLDKGKMSVDQDDASTEALKAHIDDLNANPSKMLEVGGDIGHYLPGHAAQIGALTATATQYLNSIKPKPQQATPLDDITPPSKGEMASYTRQVAIAQHPALILEHAKSGTILPQDIATVETIYPALMNSMRQKAGEALIDARTKSKDLSYKQKMGLSALLGQPLDFTQTPQAMQAIIHSAGPQQVQNQGKKQSGPKKATGTELKQINRVDEMAETPLEARQIHKKSK